jgi:hypothetical protein
MCTVQHIWMYLSASVLQLKCNFPQPCLMSVRCLSFVFTWASNLRWPHVNKCVASPQTQFLFFLLPQHLSLCVGQVCLSGWVSYFIVFKTDFDQTLLWLSSHSFLCIPLFPLLFIVTKWATLGNEANAGNPFYNILGLFIKWPNSCQMWLSYK